MIQREQQFAEKLHAYTLPRIGAVNSRVRDLVDMVLLIHSATLHTPTVVEALQCTFDRRATHPVPATLAPPPSDWSGPFRVLADECQLDLSASEAFTECRTSIRHCHSWSSELMKDDLDFAAMSWQSFRPPRSYAIVIVYVEFCIWCMEADRQTIERVAPQEISKPVGETKTLDRHARSVSTVLIGGFSNSSSLCENCQ
jgi:hypothetical protein